MKIYFPSAGSLCNIDEARVKSFSKSPIQVYAQQYYCEKVSWTHQKFMFSSSTNIERIWAEC